MFAIAEREGYTPARVAQPMYNPLARRIEDEFLPACAALGISTVVYNPLAGGLLTGKHNGGAPLPGTRFDGNRAYLDRYWNESNFTAVARLAKAAAGNGHTLVGLSLNWLLHHTPIDCVVLGASGVDQLHTNLAALDEGPLNEELLQECDQVWESLRGTAPKYNR
jgi:aryl-alcohol dehydrogenase-like predicted oxidoreductase